MMISLGIIFAIIAMLSWGIGDLLVSVISRRVEVKAFLFWYQMFQALLFIGLSFVFLPHSEFYSILKSFRLYDISILFLSAFTLLAANFFFMKAFENGNTSVVAPIANAYSAVIVLFGIIFLGEVLTSLKFFAILLTIAGTILASFKLSDLKNFRFKKMTGGVNFALLTVLSWTIGFILLKSLSNTFGGFVAAFSTNIVMSIFMGLYGFRIKSLKIKRNSIPWIIVAAMLGLSGFVFISLAFNSQYLSIVSPIGAAAPAVTVLLARLFLKEKIDWNQNLGIISIIIALILLSI